MKTILLIGALIFCVTAYGQLFSATTIADFETWQNVDADQDGAYWHVSLLFGTPGNPLPIDGECAFSFSYGDPNVSSTVSLRPDNWLISPPIDLSSAISPVLSWKVCGVDDKPFVSPDSLEHYAIVVANSIAELYTNTPLLVETLSDNELHVHSEALTAFAGSSHVYIAVRHYQCTDMMLVLDDVIITETAGIEEEPLIELSVFPNPAAEVLYFHSDREIRKIRFYDEGGVLVLESEISGVPVQDLPAGSYYYHVIFADGREVQGNFLRR